ncbi:MAG: hypothetical protein ACEQSC_00150 [Candidatus Nanopelagicaceae bacterium]
MNNRTTTQLLAVSAAIISSLCIYSSKADAQFNGSNSSGSNTTSYSGSSNSIWSSNRKEAPVQKLIPPVIYERPTEVVPETVTVTNSCPPVIKGENTVVSYNTTTGCPSVTINKPKAVYPKAIKGSVRGRG